MTDPGVNYKHIEISTMKEFIKPLSLIVTKGGDPILSANIDLSL